MAICKGTTSRGTPCKKKAMPDSEYCRSHQDQAVAPPADQSRRSQGRKIRRRRDDHRAPLPPQGILPGDKVILQEVQDRIDDLRRTPEAFRPTETKSARGEVSYRGPGVPWTTVPALDFAQMQAGTKPWKSPEPQPTDIRQLARRLKELSFLKNELCRFCHREIKVEHAPEYAQVWQCIRGRFVMPYIGHPLEPGQSELRFRHMHLACSLWEDRLADLLVSDDPNWQQRLMELRAEVLHESQKKSPDITLDEVDDALDSALAFAENQEVK